MEIDLLHPNAAQEARKHKLKRLIQSPNSFFMDVRCPGCLQITTVFSHAQSVVLCGSCNATLCQPTGGRCKLTEGSSFRRKAETVPIGKPNAFTVQLSNLIQSMNRLRHASLFDFYPVNVSLLISSIEPTPGTSHESPRLSITSVASGCGCTWFADSIGRLHRVCFNYILNTDTNSTAIEVTDISQSDIDGYLKTQDTAGGIEQETTVDASPILTATKVSTFQLARANISFIFITAPNKEPLPIRRVNSAEGYETLLVISQDSVNSHTWRCKCFLLDEKGKFVYRHAVGTSKNPRLRSAVQQSDIPKPIKDVVLTETSAVDVTAACLNTTSRILAIGLSNGVILCFHNDFKNPDAANIKMKNFATGLDASNLTILNQSPITSLFFCYSESRKSEVLFITALHAVACYALPSSPIGPYSLLFCDTAGGCGLNCASLNNSDETLSVLRDGGVFVYHSEQGNLSAVPLDGNMKENSLCETFRSYTVTVIRDPRQDQVLSPSLPSNILLDKPSRAVHQSISISLSLPSLRLLAFSARLSGVTHVKQFGTNSLLVLTRSDGFNAMEIREKTPVDKISLLTKKRMFEWAIAIGEKDKLPIQFIEETRTLYAEWLFDKGHYVASAEMFCTTVGSVEPSHVISKFLSGRRFDGLIIYIKHLYISGVATPAHLAILFKCFSLRSNLEAFETFIDHVAKPNDDIDWTVAIDECRSAGHYQLAKKIAEKQNLPSLVMSILIDDLDNVDEAIEYLLSTTTDDVCITLLLQSHIGTSLLRKQPDKTIELIKRLMESQNVDMGLFIPLFFDVDSKNSLTTLEKQEEKEVTENEKELTRFSLDLKSRDETLMTGMEGEKLLLKLLIEILTGKTKNGTSMHVAITALELLFRKERRLKVTEDVAEIRRDIELIIKNHVKSDDRLLSVFCLARLYENDSALLSICERVASMYGSSLQPQSFELNQSVSNIHKLAWAAGVMQTPFLRYQENGDARSLLSYCLKSGLTDQSIPLQALAALSSDPDNNELLKSLFNHLMTLDCPTPHPLSVIRILGQTDESHNVKLGSVKAYLLNQLSPIKSRYDQQRLQFLADCADIKQTRCNINNLRSKLQTFSLIGLLCGVCGSSVDIPMVQFLCGHAYHRYCLSTTVSDTHRKCPQCSPENESKKQLLYDRIALLLGLTPSDFVRDVNNNECGPVPVIAQVLLGRGLLLRELPEMLKSHQQ